MMAIVTIFAAVASSARGQTTTSSPNLSPSTAPMPPTTPPTAAPIVNRLLTVTGGAGEQFCVPTTVQGNPHCIVFQGHPSNAYYVDFSCTMQAHAAGGVSAVGTFHVPGVNGGCS